MLSVSWLTSNKACRGSKSWVQAAKKRLRKGTCRRCQSQLRYVLVEVTLCCKQWQTTDVVVPVASTTGECLAWLYEQTPGGN